MEHSGARKWPGPHLPGESDHPNPHLPLFSISTSDTIFRKLPLVVGIVNLTVLINICLTTNFDGCANAITAPKCTTLLLKHKGVNIFPNPFRIILRPSKIISQLLHGGLDSFSTVWWVALFCKTSVGVRFPIFLFDMLCVQFLKNIMTGCG